MLTTKVLLFIGLAALAASADVDLSKKKVIWGNGLSPHISIKSVTKSTPKFTVTRRDDWTSKCTGYDACNSKANDGLKVDSVYEVGYEDGVWLPVCLCAGYVTDAKEMASLFAYVPLRIRSAVNKLSAKPTGNGAYTMGNSGVYLGRYGPEVFIHESGHSFDFTNGIGGTKEWISAITDDPCQPDPYARSSKAEAWAQTAVLWSYLSLSGASEATLNNNTFSCWKNARTYASKILPYSNKVQFNAVTKRTITLKSNQKPISIGSDNSTLTLGGSGRQFQILIHGYDNYLIVDTVSHNGLDAYGRKNPGNRPILFGERNASKNQQWTFVEGPAGFYKISSVANGLVLDGCNNNAVTFQKDNGSDCQRWKL